jgi:hypothetical protein
LPPSGLLSISTNPRHSLLHFGATKNIKESRMKKMKKHYKGHISSLYCSYKVKRGDAWRMMQLLGHTCLKKLTHVIRFINISLFCMKIRLSSWFSIGCFVNKSLVPV